jgi:hypothetical protein
MMNLLLPFTLLLAAAAGSPAQPTVETAVGDWSKLPSLETRVSENLNTKAMARLHAIARDGECSLPGYAKGNLVMRLSFAAQFDPAGSLQRILLPKLDCPEAEGIIGGALLAMVKGGDYRPTGKNPDGWYQGQLNFTFEGES